MINNLLEFFNNCDFDGQLTDSNFHSKVIKNLPEDFKYKYAIGATKLCIIPENEKYVIKIPFNGESGLFNGLEKFFYATKDDRYRWDYCLEEVLVYNLAKLERVHDAFCKTRMIGFVKEHPIYIQQKAEIFKSKKGKEHFNHFSDEYCDRYDFYCFNTEWIADAIKYYGTKKFNQIMIFLKNNNIEDLHDENIGYIGEKPVLIDYSNYND